MTNKGELVLVQVSGGSDDILNPGLNTIGGMQPRGPKGSIPGISGNPDEAAVWSIDMVEDGWVVSELTVVSLVMSCISLRFIMSRLDKLDRCGISGMVVDCPVAVVMFSGSIPSPGPDLRMLSGRHCTLPWPLAKILSTHDGKAPVLIYRANMTSESSCVQSFRRMFVASRSAARSAVTSLLF